MIPQLRYETLRLAEAVVDQFIMERLTDMECLAAVRKLKSVYDLLNRVDPK